MTNTSPCTLILNISRDRDIPVTHLIASYRYHRTLSDNLPTEDDLLHCYDFLYQTEVNMSHEYEPVPTCVTCGKESASNLNTDVGGLCIECIGY